MTNLPKNYLDLKAYTSFEGTVRVPGSKSISNRALLLAALADGETRIHHLLSSDDTRHMGNALKGLGLQISFNENGSEAIVKGIGKTFAESAFPVKNGTFFLGNAGTAMRSLTAALCVSDGIYTLTGEDRMYERPIDDLIQAMRSLGAKIECLKTEGYPPLKIKAHGISKTEVSVRGNISSQYLTAILLCAPYSKNGLTIHVEGELISKPYIALTLAMMHSFGVDVENDDFKSFKVPHAIYKSPHDYEVEGDASSASYPLAAAAISKSTVTVEGVFKESIQGDVHFAEVLKAMGASVLYGKNSITCTGSSLCAVDLNLNSIPDAAMTVAVMALFAKGTTRIRGIGSWKVKETDRLFAIETELKKVGAIVTRDDDSISITPPMHLKSATIETYNDHRMAMCFSLISLGNVPMRILNPSCVNKTYPDFFKDFLAHAK